MGPFSSIPRCWAATSLAISGAMSNTYAFNEDWVLDIGGTASPTDDADDFTVFAGTSFRL